MLRIKGQTSHSSYRRTYHSSGSNWTQSKQSPIRISAHMWHVAHSQVGRSKLPIRIRRQPPSKPRIIHPELKLVPARAVVLLCVLSLIPPTVRFVGNLPTVHGQSEGIVVRSRYYGGMLVVHDHLIKEHPIGTVAPIVHEYINKSRLLNGDLRHGHLRLRHIAGGGYSEEALLTCRISIRVKNNVLQVRRRKGGFAPAADITAYSRIDVIVYLPRLPWRAAYPAKGAGNGCHHGRHCYHTVVAATRFVIRPHLRAELIARAHRQAYSRSGGCRVVHSYYLVAYYRRA